MCSVSISWLIEKKQDLVDGAEVAIQERAVLVHEDLGTFVDTER